MVAVFSPFWWQTIGTIGASLFVLWLLARRTPTEKAELGARLLAAVAVGRVVVQQIVLAVDGSWDATVYLPLHMCTLSGLLGAALLLRPRQGLYELVYYWGIGGTLQALLTPEVPVNASAPVVADFYVGHSIVPAIVIWATVAMGMRPRPGSWWRVFLATQLVLPTIGGINWLLGANYMYLCAPPPVENPLVIGDFPLHLLGFEVAVIVNFALLYLPWWLGKRRRGGSGS